MKRSVVTRVPHLARVRRIVIVAFEQAQALDIAGPADVFALANRLHTHAAYEIRIASTRGDGLTLSNGLRIHTDPVVRFAAGTIDTLIVAGGEREGLIAALQDVALRRWVLRQRASLRRLASVCSGSFALAHWGLLDDHRATTHWSAARTLDRHFPKVQVMPDALFVNDRDTWTSGGVTAGIDMCLAMVEADLGRVLATRVARQLVLSARRVGNQAQYSAPLQGHAGRFADLVEWMQRHLRERLDVETLAQRAGLSGRSFCRHFAAEAGSTPAHYVETLRLHHARTQLEAGASVKAAARAAGFTSDEQLARVFRRRLAMSPGEYRRGHRQDPLTSNRVPTKRRGDPSPRVPA